MVIMTINTARNRVRDRETRGEIEAEIEIEEIEIEEIETIGGETDTGMVEGEVEIEAIEIEEIGGIDIGVRNSWSFLQPGG